VDELLTELQKLGKFVKYAWSKAPPDNYGVIAIDGQTALKASDRQSESIPEGTIDWFCRNPASTMPGSIETVLDSAGAAWYLNSVQYESDTGLLHWEWVWQYG